jgi:protoporphyrinogen/coproporphyrinogen III oxidase
VIGGGMAGLGAARALEDERIAGGGFDWILFEEERRFGGKVRTVRRDGFVIEGGPDSAIIEKPWPIQMARRLGIGDRLLDSNEDIRRSYVYTRGGLHELPEGIILMVPTRIMPFAASGLISWPGKLRMGLDLLLPKGGAARTGGDETLSHFVTRRLGREALERIAEPIVAGIHAGDPQQMSVQATFPMFLQMEREHRSLIVGMLGRRRARARAKRAAGAAPSRPAPRSYFYSFTGGLTDLADAMAASLPTGRLRSGVGVAGIAVRDGASIPGDVPPATHGLSGPAGGSPGRRDPCYVLTLSDGTREEVDAVVLATPAWAAGDLLRTVAPAASAGLSSIDYVSTATVSVAFRRDAVSHGLRGFGYVTPRAEHRPVMATTWSSSKFAGRAPEGCVLLRSFLGRAGREAAAQLDDGEMTRVVRAELGEVMGIHAEPELVEIFRWPRGMPQYRVGHVDLVDRIERAVADVPGVELAGGAYHGIGIGDCLREGATAARRAVECVRGLPEDAVPPQPADVPAIDGVAD